MSFKFIHAADLHLDSPLRGLERYEGAPADDLRSATRRALENLVALAVEERVAFVLLAGDLFDGDWQDFNTGLFFSSQMTALRAHGIRVFVVRGNHDAATRITRNLQFPDNVRVLSHEQPETVLLEDLGVAVHGMSFQKAATTEDLASRYPARIPDALNLGLLHTCVNGREGHDSYAPCSLDVLRAKGYDYWALGHVHQREVLSERPYIAFSGNVQGRHIREAGAKGCLLATVVDGTVADVDFRALDVLRWALVEVSVEGAASVDEIYDRLRERLRDEVRDADGRPLAVRLVVRGRCAAHDEIAARPETVKSQIRGDAHDLSGGALWIEKIALQTAPEIDMMSLLQRSDPIGSLLQMIRSLQSDDDGLRELAARFDGLRHKLPLALTESREDAVALGDLAYLRAALQDVERTLIPQLLEGAERA